MEPMVNLSAILEALLFVIDEPVSAKRLAAIVEAPVPAVETELRAMAQARETEERGVQLREVAGGWRFYTHPGVHDYVEKFVLSWDTRRLSQAALEALAVIAYHQPVTRSSVNAVRGVNSEGVIASLVEKGLVREVGRDKNAGSAILYGTTKTFLEKFGLKDVSELPPLEQFAPDEETAQAIRERLSSNAVIANDEGGTDEEGVPADGSSELTVDDEPGDADAAPAPDDDDLAEIG